MDKSTRQFPRRDKKTLLLTLLILFILILSAAVLLIRYFTAAKREPPGFTRMAHSSAKLIYQILPPLTPLP